MRTSVFIAAALALAAAPVGAADPWWSSAWSIRRAVSVPVEHALTALPGEDAAVVTLATAGKCLPDGADLRVTTDRGQLLPSRVLMMGPGDTARLAFAVRRDVKRYYVYLGNPAARPADPLALRRGLLMETWEYDGGRIGTFDDVRRLAESPSRKLIGRGFVDRLFLGYNPFGPQSAVVSLFAGTLKCPADGVYGFCTSSENASFLLIDDAVVVYNGGQHKPQHQVRVQATATLKAGPHKLTFYHASRGGDPVVVAAWRPPGEKDFHVIPADSFAPIAHGEPGPLSLPDNAPCADFTAAHEGEGFMEDRYFHRYRFRASAAGPAGSPRWAWDFGDGQAAEGSDVEHVYLRPGLYTVTLTGRAGSTLTRTNRIFVSRRWDRVTTSEVEGLDKQARIVATYDFTKADPETILWAMLLCRREGQADAVLRAGQALAARGSIPASVAERALPLYADLLAGAPAEAGGMLAKAASAVEGPRAAADLLCRAGGFYLRAGDDKAAEAQYSRVVERYAGVLNAQEVRPARIGMGDVWRRRGELEKARAAYRAAGVSREYAGRNAALAKGDLARHVEAYLRQGQLEWAREYLETWQGAYPEDRLEGYVTLLWVRWHGARKEWAAAGEAAEELVRVNPASTYAPRLLLEGAKAWEAAGRARKRKELLERVGKEYPESAEAQEAGKLLAK